MNNFLTNFPSIIKNFEGKKILIIGDLILDSYIFGKVSRISPEAPVPVLEVVKETFRLGGAANVANNIASLGGIPSVAGIIGNDSAGQTLYELLKSQKVNCDLIVVDKRPTSIKTRIIAHTQQIVRVDKEETKKVEGKTLEKLLNQIGPVVEDYDAIIISDYKKGVISSTLMSKVITFAKQYNKFISVDPKIGHFHLYKDVTLLTPNLFEASHGAGIDIKDEKSLIKAGKILINKLHCKSVLITRGDNGMTLFKRNLNNSNIEFLHFPTMAKKVYDVTGAGDTVIAIFTLAYTAGATMEESAVIANHAAGIVVEELGTAVPTLEKLVKSLRALINNK